MKFVLTKEHTYWWPVKVAIPDPDPARAGKLIEQEFRMQFVSIGQDEAQALADEIAALEPKERAAREHDLILRVSKDWADIVDEDQQPVPFSEEMFRAAMQSPFYRAAVYRAYNASMRGEAARKGN